MMGENLQNWAIPTEVHFWYGKFIVYQKFNACSQFLPEGRTSPYERKYNPEIWSILYSIYVLLCFVLLSFRERDYFNIISPPP